LAQAFGSSWPARVGSRDRFGISSVALRAHSPPTMLRAVLLPTLLGLVAAGLLHGEPALGTDGGTDIDALKAIVTSAKIFKDKVAATCDHAGQHASECAAVARDRLFCQLLQRSRPAAAVASQCVGHVGSSAPVSLPAPVSLTATVLTQTEARRQLRKAPEDDLAKEMTHDLEMNFQKIAPFGKEDTAKELQDHAAKTQDTLVDAVENAEVAEIKRAVFRALTRLRAATIKEFDTIARLETQAIDAYNDAHHYRAENPLAHLHEDEAPVETDKLKSFH